VVGKDGLNTLPFTTLRLECGAPWFWEDHVARLRETAVVLGLPLPSPGDLYAALPRTIGGTSRVRLTILRDGSIQTEITPYEPPTEAWRLKSVPIEADPDLACYKTTSRVWFDAARELLGEEDDALLVLAGGHDVAGSKVLETTIANLFFEIGGEIVTPAASAPLLPGIARARLLTCEPRIEERVLIGADVVRATACCVTNALMGVHPVETIDGGQTLDSDELARELMDRLRSTMQESV